MDYKEKIINILTNKELTSEEKKQLEKIFPELVEYEDEKIRKGIESIIKHYRDNGETVCPYPFVTIEEALTWLEKQGQKPTEWHREDEQNLNACLGYISDEFLRRWLKDIIYAKHDKSAWSEEDENHYQMLQKIICNSDTSASLANKLSDWLNQLKLQKQWKPTKKQIDALDSTLQYSQVSRNYYDSLNSLYNDLKKLTE